MASVASYPKVPSTAWHTLRSRVASAPSTRLTANVVATILDMAPRSAIDNVIKPLRRLGIIDDEGALTERGTRWRVDATYAEVCQEIIDEIYPSDLTSLVDQNGQPEKSQVNTWFHHHGFGESNARQMAATYVIIAEKRIPDATSVEPKKRPTKTTQKKTRSPRETSPQNVTNAADPPAEVIDLALPPERPIAAGPNIHLDVQIHIPAGASPDQIEQIFASMAKHLYQR